MAERAPISLDWTPPKSLQKAKSKFEGPGIYMVLSAAVGDGGIDTNTYQVLDIGQTRKAQERLEGHPRQACWEEVAPKGTKIYIKFAQMSESGYNREDRRDVECCLRSHTDPECGEECDEGYSRENPVTVKNEGKRQPLDQQYSCDV